MDFKDIYEYHLPYHSTLFFYFPEILLTIKLSLAITIVTQMREQKKRWEPKRSFLIHNTIHQDSAVTSPWFSFLKQWSSLSEWIQSAYHLMTAIFLQDRNVTSQVGKDQSWFLNLNITWANKLINVIHQRKWPEYHFFCFFFFCL